jgi:cytochrome c oxidase cbb3-type subunit 3/ubiquinol-cytochrome c reductase cytochrome c subunit
MKTALLSLAGAALLLGGCESMPGRPAPGPEVPRPDSILSSKVLYAQNCAGCHGVDGTHGPATPLASPVFQSLVDDATLRRIVADGLPNSMMPAFARSAGGELTDAQVDAIVHGLREQWGGNRTIAPGQAPPLFEAEGSEEARGDARAGEQVYAQSCSRCHGQAGGRVGHAGSVLDPDFLALMTPAILRSAIIVGRPDFGMPDWRGKDPGRPLSAQNVSDVVAFLMAQQPDYMKTDQPQPTPPVGPQTGTTKHGRFNGGVR